MDDPVGALIGTILIGFGLVLFYGAFKNRKVFGAGGIIPTVLTTGTLADLTEVPVAFKIEKTEADKATVTATWEIPLATQSAISHIGQTDPSLAEQIDDAVRSTDSNSDRPALMKLAQLLALADAKGFGTDTAVIRLYIRTLTGESI